MELVTDPLTIRKQVGALIEDYPVDAILRELIQNADDARATWFRACLFLCPPPEAVDTKLSKLVSEGQPFLVIGNNGPIDKKHRQAMMGIHASAKPAGAPGEMPPVGRFGLGLKSVFSLCEAFFAFHEEINAVDEDDALLAAGHSPHGFAVIPGMPASKSPDIGYSVQLTKDWRDFACNAAEVQVLYTALKALVCAVDDQPLILLIPLRMPDTKRPLKDWTCSADEEPRAKTHASAFWKQVVAGDWPRLWPLLIGSAHLNSVQFKFGAEEFLAELSVGARRPRAPAGGCDSEAGSGCLQVTAPPQGGQTRSVQAAYSYARLPPRTITKDRVACANELPFLNQTHRNELTEGWPIAPAQSQHDDDTPQQRTAEAAVWLYWASEPDWNKNSLLAGARWACGLPLAGKNSNQEVTSSAAHGSNARRGYEGLQFVLHGAFQPEHTRTALVMTEDFSGAWNLRMVQYALKMVPSAIHQFTIARSLKDADKILAGANKALEQVLGPEPVDVHNLSQKFGYEAQGEVATELFWQAVQQAAVVLPLLRAEESGLGIGHRLIERPCEKLRVLRLPAELAENLAVLQKALPGLLEVSASGAALTVRCGASDALATLPAVEHLNKDLFRAWTAKELISLRPVESSVAAGVAVRALNETLKEEVNKDLLGDLDVKRWLAGIIIEALVATGTATPDLKRPSSKDDRAVIVDLVNKIKVAVFYAPSDLPSELYDLLLRSELPEAAAGQLWPLLLPGEWRPMTTTQPDRRPEVAGAWVDRALGWAARAPSSDKDTGLLIVLSWVKEISGATWTSAGVWSPQRQGQLTGILKTRLAQHPDYGLKAAGLLEYVTPGRVFALPELPDKVTIELVTKWKNDPDCTGVLVPQGVLKGIDAPRVPPVHPAPWVAGVRNKLWAWATGATCRNEYNKVSLKALFDFLWSLARDRAEPAASPSHADCVLPWFGTRPTAGRDTRQTILWDTPHALRGPTVPQLFAVAQIPPEKVGKDSELAAALFLAFKPGQVGLTLPSAAELAGLEKGTTLVDQVQNWMASENCGQFVDDESGRLVLLKALNDSNS